MSLNNKECWFVTSCPGAERCASCVHYLILFSFFSGLDGGCEWEWLKWDTCIQGCGDNSQTHTRMIGKHSIETRVVRDEWNYRKLYQRENKNNNFVIVLPGGPLLEIDLITKILAEPLCGVPLCWETLCLNLECWSVPFEVFISRSGKC